MRKKKLSAVLIMTLCLAGTCATVTSYADEANYGPGFSLGAPREAGEVSSVAGDYYLQPLDASIVPTSGTYTYDQLSKDIVSLQKIYGKYMKVHSLGKTWDNREIYDVVVGNPNAEKQILIQGGIHGREYITSQLIMKQLEYVLAFYNSGTANGRRLSEDLQQMAIHFVPMVNPDGVTISQLHAGGVGLDNLRQMLHVLHQNDGSRLDCNSYLTLWKANARGVDLNHNFFAGWDTVKSPGRLSAEDYKGETPLSEPESAALAGLTQQYPIKLCINYHSMGQVIYWDVEGNRQREASLRLAQIFSQATGYRIDGELGKGGFKDWVQTKENPIPSITLEVGRSRCPVPDSEFPEIWAQNQSAVALAIMFLGSR